MTAKVYICPKCHATSDREGKCSNCGGSLQDFESYSEEQWQKLVAESEDRDV